MQAVRTWGGSGQCVLINGAPLDMVLGCGLTKGQKRVVFLSYQFPVREFTNLTFEVTSLTFEVTSSPAYAGRFSIYQFVNLPV